MRKGMKRLSLGLSYLFLNVIISKKESRGWGRVGSCHPGQVQGLQRPHLPGGEALATPGLLEPFAKPFYRSSCKIGLFCHPERSEGSQAFENTRFFAALRMTPWQVMKV
jgi:hypothetical protein